MLCSYDLLSTKFLKFCKTTYDEQDVQIKYSWVWLWDKRGKHLYLKSLSEPHVMKKRRFIFPWFPVSQPLGLRRLNMSCPTAGWWLNPPSSVACDFTPDGPPCVTNHLLVSIHSKSSTLSHPFPLPSFSHSKSARQAWANCLWASSNHYIPQIKSLHNQQKHLLTHRFNTQVK